MTDWKDKSNSVTALSRSDYSPHSSSPAWWHDPTRITAIVGAIMLRWYGRLDQIETAIVLAAAVGGGLTQSVIEAVKRLRGRGSK